MIPLRLTSTCQQVLNFENPANGMRIPNTEGTIFIVGTGGGNGAVVTVQLQRADLPTEYGVLHSANLVFTLAAGKLNFLTIPRAPFNDLEGFVVLYVDDPSDVVVGVITPENP